ncbi:MAG: ABC transporter ATP-binding protein [Egibacteraceae bacterium]
MSDARILLPTASARQTRQAVRALLRPRRGLLVAAIGVLVAATVAALVGPALLGRIVDLAVSGRSAAAITAPVVGLLVAAGANGVLQAIGTVLVARLGELSLAVLRERVVDRALRVPLDDVERAGTGDLLSRVSDDVSTVSYAFRDVLPRLVTSALTIGLTVVGLGVLDPRLALAGLVAAPVQILALRWYVPKTGPMYAAERVAKGAQAQALLDSIGGAATVRAFRLGSSHLRRVADRSLAAADTSFRAAMTQTWFFHRLNRAELAGLSTVLIAGFFLVRSGTVTVGDATAAALYFQRLFNPFNMLLSLVDDIQSAIASLARLVGVAELPAPPEPAQPAEPADASVEASDLYHAYVPGHEVLIGVDLSMAAGERVALVGASGAGKTTLAKLVAGVHDPTSGQVQLGGASLDALGPAATRRAVALITQEVYVFAGTLAEDLRLARPRATDAELEDALDVVGALAWVRALPEGLATVVGHGGHDLTATQAQQLALARLVLADPPVAILDEATAEAGSAGARVLERSAARALQGRTALVIAHRLTQAATADRIVVLDAGRVVEVGTHDQLVAAEGPYAALWTAWSSSRR